MNNDFVETINMTIGDTTDSINMAIGENAGSIDFNIDTVEGTRNYEKLTNKPQINSVELLGNKSLDQLGIQEAGDYADTRITNLEIDALFL